MFTFTLTFFFFVGISISVGDAVLVPPTDATLLIPYNDYPNGLFQFAANSRAFVANEGTYVTLK